MRNAHFTSIRRVTREVPGAVECVSGSPSVEPVYDIMIQHRELIAAVTRLPLQYGKMLILVVMLGESYECAAGICNCPIGTVKSRVNRARCMGIEDLAAKAPDIPPRPSRDMRARAVL